MATKNGRTSIDDFGYDETSNYLGNGRKIAIFIQYVELTSKRTLGHDKMSDYLTRPDLRGNGLKMTTFGGT